MRRRDLIKLGVTSAAAPFGKARVGAYQSPASPSENQGPRGPCRGERPVLSARLGKPVRYSKTSGDLWAAAWADDDLLYVVSDDTTGFDFACGPGGSNLAISRISGTAPPDIHGVTINPMKQFGRASEGQGDDGGYWKAASLACVDGVLYMSVKRDDNLNWEYPTWTQEPGGHVPYFVVESWDGSLVKSHDHGRTWTPVPTIGQPMFAGKTFSCISFVQYGKDGVEVKKDEADKYVYAVSNDGAWNNGNWMIMGRVRRDRMARLDPHDWEFIRGFGPRNAAVWAPRLDEAHYIFRAPGRTGMATIQYIAPLDLYIMPQWYYTYLDDAHRRWQATALEFYHAPAPWGPWTLFHAQHFEPESWYTPSIPSKFISEDGKQFWMFVSGDFMTAATSKADLDTLYYGLWMIPVTLEVNR